MHIACWIGFILVITGSIGAWSSNVFISVSYIPLLLFGATLILFGELFEWKKKVSNKIDVLTRIYDKMTENIEVEEAVTSLRNELREDITGIKTTLKNLMWGIGIVLAIISIFAAFSK